MGFGVLFFGHLIGMNFVYRGFTDIISYLIILYALTLLYRHNKFFKSSFYTLIPLSVFGALFFVLEIISFIGIEAELDLVLIRSYYSIATSILKLIYTVFLLKGIEKLALELDIPTIRIKAFRNRFFIWIYYPLLIFTELSQEGVAAKIAQYAFLPVMLFGVICLILNAALFYSCYMWICLEGDEDMRRDTSRFKLINLINKKEDALAEKIVERKKEKKLSADKTKKSKGGKK